MTPPNAEPMGHEDKTQSTISFNNSTRTFSIAPVSSTFTIWNSGVRYIKESTETVQIPNTSGLYYIYYDNSGSLQYRTSYFDWDDDAPTAYIYWNATASTAYFFADERHGITLDWQTHEYLHRTRGAVIAEGFGASNFVTNGDGSSDSHAKLDIAGGTFFDEDLEVNITHSETPTADTWEQTLEGNAEIPVFYHSGSEWVKDAATEFPFKHNGSNVPVYNSYSGSWSTTAVTNNKFFISWIIATNNLNEPIIAVLGQASYNTIGTAEEATWDDLNLDGFPVFEFRPLYKVIFQYSSGYTNTYKSAIRQVYDLRRVSSSGSAIPTTPVSDHGSLTGLGDDDHSQYVHTSIARTITANHTFSNGLTAASVSITGTPTNATDAVTKQYVDAAIAGLHWHEAVRLATNAVLPNSPTYSNGESGNGATLTAGENARLLIDSTNASTGDRVLVKNQASGIQNGIYRVVEQGGPSLPWVLERAEDFDGSVPDGEQTYAGEAVYVTAGTINIRQGFVVSSTGTGENGAHIFGTDSIVFTQFTGTSAFAAGDGMVQDGNTLNVATAGSNRIVVNADSIDLAGVDQTNSNGSDGISFVKSHSVDNYGRITGTVTADVQDASTSQKGIARFNSSNFTVSSGSVSIANDGIILGTHTTGNYLREIVAGPGLIVIHTPGEGSTASIELDPVITSSSAGTSGINFISSITTDGTGRITSYTASDVQDARLSNEMGITKGIASFDYQNFTASSGVISIANNGITLGTHTTGDYVSNISAGTGVNITGGTGESSSVTIDIGQAVNTAASVAFARLSLTSDASFNDGRILISRTGFGTGPGDYSAKIVFDANGTQEQFILRHNDYYGAETADIILRNSTGTDTATGIRLVADTSSVGIIVGPRLEVGSVSNLTAPYSTTSSSVVMTVYRSSPACVGVKITDTASSSTNLFEWADSLGVVVGSISGYSNGYRFNATTASIGSLNVGGNITVGGNLTINGTTTTVNSTTITVDDPIITLGGDTAPSSDDNKDRGIEFRYHSGTAASVGFMGYDDSTGRFVFLTGATNTSEVFSGTNASVEVGSLQSTYATDYGVMLHSQSSTGTVETKYGPTIYGILQTDMGGPKLMLNYGNTEGIISIENAASSRFTFSRPIFGASIQSASINAPILSGSVHYDSSASVTLPAKTFFPEEYLAVSSSVTLNSTTHRYATLEMTATSGTSVITVPADASDNFPIGSVIQIVRVGAGEVQVNASAGVTVNNAVGTRLRAQWSTATLRKRAANTWLLSGDLKV